MQRLTFGSASKERSRHGHRCPAPPDRISNACTVFLSVSSCIGSWVVFPYTLFFLTLFLLLLGDQSFSARQGLFWSPKCTSLNVWGGQSRGQTSLLGRVKSSFGLNMPLVAISLQQRLYLSHPCPHRSVGLSNLMARVTCYTSNKPGYWRVPSAWRRLCCCCV